MNAVDTYRALTCEIADVAEQSAAKVNAAEEARAAGQQQLDARLEAARSTLATRKEQAKRAAEDVRRTEETVERVWHEVRAYVGRRAAERLPDMPEVRPGPAGMTTESALTEAKDLMSRARRGEWSADPMKYRGAVAIAVGALVAALVFGVAKMVLGISSEDDIFLHLVAQLAVFLSPFAGIPLIGWGMTRFRGYRADVGTVGLTVLGGLVVSCVLTFLLH